MGRLLSSGSRSLAATTQAARSRAEPVGGHGRTTYTLGPLRPPDRARRLRRRLCGEHLGREVARHRRAGARRAPAPRPSRRQRLRSGDGGRRGDPAPDPAPLLQARGAAPRLGHAAAEALRHRHGVSAAGPAQPPRLRGGLRGGRQRAGAVRDRLARRAGRRERGRHRGKADAAGDPPDLHRLSPGDPLGARAQALRDPQAHREPGARARRRPRGALPRREPLGGDHRLQGPAAPQTGPALLPRPDRPRHGQRARGRPLALLDQHLPDLGSGAAVPLRGPQRRDQHAPGQHQPDARPARHPAVGEVRRAARPPLPDHRRAGQRLGAVRQHARAAAPRRAVPRPRDDDAHPRGVGVRQAHGPRTGGVLRVLFEPDGAVGWAGGHRVHRRAPDRRDAGPQRAPTGALARDERRSRHPELRGRRRRHRADGRARQGAAAAGADVPGRHHRGPHHQRRRGQARGVHALAVPALARLEPLQPRRRAGLDPAAAGGG